MEKNSNSCLKVKKIVAGGGGATTKKDTKKKNNERSIRYVRKDKASKIIEIFINNKPKTTPQKSNSTTYYPKQNSNHNISQNMP